MSSPLLSVIIPTYNSARYLPLTLQSLFEQDFTAYEVIVVDDGSTDETAQAVAPFSERIRFVAQPNAGSAAARNRGLALAQGELVLFLDADDLLLPGTLRRRVDCLQKRPFLGYLHSGWQQIDEAGQLLQTVEPWHNAPHLTLTEWLRYKPVQLGAILFRRHWLEQVSGLDPDLRQAHDVDLMLRLSLAGCRGAWLKLPTIGYRQHPHSTMRRSAQVQAESVRALLDKFFSLPNLPPTIQAEKQQTYYYATLWLAWHLYQSGAEQTAVSYLKQTLTLASAWTDLPPVYTVVDWLLHFTRWQVENGRLPTDLHPIWPIWQQAAPQLNDWPHLARLRDWLWHSGAATHLWTAFDLWRIFCSALDWEAGNPDLAAATMMTWWVQVWHHYRRQAYDQAATALAAFPHLDQSRLLRLLNFSLMAEPDLPSSALLNLLWRDAQAAGLLPAANWDEPDFMAQLPPVHRPKVSVIVPTYNNRSFLPATIDSVLAQTYSDYELIVVDDGSTDDTVAVLRPYNGQIRYLPQTNQGVSAARNRGLALALGDYIVFLDGDDLLLPHKLARQVAFLDTNQAVGVVHSGWQTIAENGQPRHTIEPWHQAPQLDLATWLRWKPVFLGAMMFRRRWLAAMPGFDPALRQAEDTDLMLRLAAAGCPMAWLPEVTVRYRQHGANTMRNGRQQAEAIMQVLDRFFGRADLPAAIRRLENQVRYDTLLWVVWHLFRTGDHEAITPYLRQTLPHMDHATGQSWHTTRQWLAQLAQHALTDAVPLTDLNFFLPHFGAALGVAPTEWPAEARLLQEILTRWSVLGHSAGEDEWQYAQMALQMAALADSLPADRIFGWWVLVWRHYLAQKPDSALVGLAQFNDLPTADLVALVQHCIVWRPEEVVVAQIGRFWADAQVSGLIGPECRWAVTGLYLTCFGQAVLGQRWSLAWAALGAAVQQGAHRQTVRAWRRFIAKGLRYYAMAGTARKQDSSLGIMKIHRLSSVVYGLFSKETKWL
jgi:glycosyltransferase involved in cell wall biosynthesis